MKYIKYILALGLVLVFSGCTTPQISGFNGICSDNGNAIQSEYDVFKNSQKKIFKKVPFDSIEKFKIWYRNESSLYKKYNNIHSQRNEVKECINSRIITPGYKVQYEMYIYFPKNYKTMFPMPTVVAQIFQESTTPLIWLEEKNGLIIDDKINNKLIYLIDKDNLKNKWYKITINVYFSKKGYIKIYVDDKLKQKYNGSFIKNNFNKIYFKYGIYRPNIEEYRVNKKFDIIEKNILIILT